LGPTVKLCIKDTLINDEKTKRDHCRFVRQYKMKKIVTKGEESVTPSTVIAAEVLYDDVTSKLTFSNTMF